MKTVFVRLVFVLLFSIEILSGSECAFGGFYVGGNGGVLSHITHNYRGNNLLSEKRDWSQVTTNLAIGCQLGWDYLWGQKLFGIVGDFDGVGNNDWLTDPNDPYHSSRLNWYTTARGRAGVVFGDALLYLTGGAAFINFETHVNVFEGQPKLSRIRSGWAAGGGLEFFTCDRFTVGAEFLAMLFNVDRASGRRNPNFHWGRGESCMTLRLLVNYRL